MGGARSVEEALIRLGVRSVRLDGGADGAEMER